MPKYVFKPTEELMWGIVIAAATVLLMSLVSLGDSGPADWRTWLVAVAIGMVRAAAGAALDWLRRSAQARNNETGQITDELS